MDKQTSKPEEISYIDFVRKTATENPQDLDIIVQVNNFLWETYAKLINDPDRSSKLAKEITPFVEKITDPHDLAIARETAILLILEILKQQWAEKEIILH